MLLSSFDVGKKREQAQLTWKTKLTQSCRLYMHLILIPFTRLVKRRQVSEIENCRVYIKLHLSGKSWWWESVYIVVHSLGYCRACVMEAAVVTGRLVLLFIPHVVLQTRRGSARCFSQTGGQQRVEEETRGDLEGVVIGKALKRRVGAGAIFNESSACIVQTFSSV